MLLTKNELEIEALKKEIIACNALDRAEEGLSKVEQLEKLVNMEDNLERQFILRSKALLGWALHKGRKIKNAYPSYWTDDSGF